MKNNPITKNKLFFDFVEMANSPCLNLSDYEFSDKIVYYVISRNYRQFLNLKPLLKNKTILVYVSSVSSHTKLIGIHPNKSENALILLDGWYIDLNEETTRLINEFLQFGTLLKFSI